MATRKRQNTNPFMSANLGSGARTTTGGTYENPRLGIQDYTAFGSGVASTFRMPEKEEVEKKDDLTLDLGDFESDRDDFYVDSNGVMQDLNSDVSTLINNTWKGSELTFLNNAYQQALAGSQQERDIKSHLNGYSQAIGPKDSNFINYLNALDSGIHDHNVSNRFLPSLDGDNLNGTIADFIRIGNENPNAIKIASKKNKNGIMQYGYEVDGLGFVNASVMTDKWINKNFSVKYNQASSLSADYEEFQISKFKPMFYDSGTNLFEGTDQEFKVKRENEIVQDGSIDSFELTTYNAANNRFSSQNDPYFKSAYYNLDSAIGGIGNITLTEDGAGGYTINYPENSKFKFSSEIEKAMGDLVFSDNVSQQDQDALKISMLKDHYKENFKLTNGSNMYVKGEDGRAIAKTASNLEEFMPDYMKTEQKTELGGGFSFGFGTGSGGSADSYVAGLQQLYGAINPDTEQRQGGIVDKQGNVPLEKVADFAQEWGVKTHGAGTKVMSIMQIEKYYKDLYNYDDAKQSSRDNNNPGKDQIDAMINDMFKQEPSYFYYVPSGGKDPIPAENLGKLPDMSSSEYEKIRTGMIKEPDKGINVATKYFGPSLRNIPINSFMREYRNSLSSSEKKLFEGAASRMGINIYGVQLEPKKEN